MLQITRLPPRVQQARCTLLHLVRSDGERKCSNLGPTQSRTSPSVLQYTKKRKGRVWEVCLQGRGLLACFFSEPGTAVLLGKTKPGSAVLLIRTKPGCFTKKNESCIGRACLQGRGLRLACFFSEQSPARPALSPAREVGRESVREREIKRESV